MPREDRMGLVGAITLVTLFSSRLGAAESGPPGPNPLWQEASEAPEAQIWLDRGSNPIVMPGDGSGSITEATSTRTLRSSRSMPTVPCAYCTRPLRRRITTRGASATTGSSSHVPSTGTSTIVRASDTSLS